MKARENERTEKRMKLGTDPSNLWQLSFGQRESRKLRGRQRLLKIPLVQSMHFTREVRPTQACTDEFLRRNALLGIFPLCTFDFPPNEIVKKSHVGFYAEAEDRGYAS